MDESFSYRGYFWLPEHPEARISGTLSFSHAEIALELLGSFDGAAALTGLISRERILGLSADGKPLTLEQCQQRGSVLVTSGLQTSRYAPSYVLVGAWFE